MRQAVSRSVSNTFCRSNAEWLMTLRTSAVAASRAYASAKARLSVAMLSSVLSDTFGRAVSFNSSSFALRFLAEAVADASLRPARRVRPPCLRPFALDSPRRICRRPLDSVGRGLESITHSCAAHGLDTQRQLYCGLNTNLSIAALFVSSTRC